MDLNIRVIHLRDFLRATPSGNLDLERSKELLWKLASENASGSKYDILLDVRKAETSLTLMDVTELVDVMIANRDSFLSRLAILVPPEATLKIAKFMELYAGNRGFQVAAFKNYEKVMDWLMNSPQSSTDG
jgi:hypothetical protein